MKNVHIQAFFQAFLPQTNGIKKFDLNWVSKPSIYNYIFFLYYNLFDPEKKHIQVKLSPNTERLLFWIINNYWKNMQLLKQNDWF